MFISGREYVLWVWQQMTSEFTVVWYDRPKVTVGSTDSTQGILGLVLTGNVKCRFADKIKKNHWFQTFVVLLMLYSFFLGGGDDTSASEFYMPTFRNTLFHLHRSYEQELWRWIRECSETSAYKIRTMGYHPKERMQIDKKNSLVYVTSSLLPQPCKFT